MWSELTHVQDPPCNYFFWQTSYSKWSLAPEQVVQHLRTFLDGGVLGPLGSLRSASSQQTRLTCSVFPQRPSNLSHYSTPKIKIYGHSLSAAQFLCLCRFMMKRAIFEKCLSYIKKMSLSTILKLNSVLLSEALYLTNHF